MSLQVQTLLWHLAAHRSTQEQRQRTCNILRQLSRIIPKHQRPSGLVHPRSAFRTAAPASPLEQIGACDSYNIGQAESPDLWVSERSSNSSGSERIVHYGHNSDFDFSKYAQTRSSPSTCSTAVHTVATGGRDRSTLTKVGAHSQGTQTSTRQSLQGEESRCDGRQYKQSVARTMFVHILAEHIRGDIYSAHLPTYL